MRALLQFTNSATSSQFPSPPASSAAAATTTTSTDDDQNSFTADIIVVLAALLCAVICMAGLALINRCNNALRESSSNATTSAALHQQQHADIQLPLPPLPPKRGLKKSALKALPKTRYDKAIDIENQTECVICLMEFEEGEEIRKLPQCGHEFHVGCVDKWLRAQSSCPSCRRVLVVVPPPKQGFEKGGPRNKAAIGGGTSTFLP